MRSGCCWRYGHYLTCASSAAALVPPPAALPLRSFSYALRPLLTQRLLSYVLRPPLELKLRLNLELNLKLTLKTLFAICPVAFLCTASPVIASYAAHSPAPLRKPLLRPLLHAAGAQVAGGRIDWLHHRHPPVEAVV